jgi:hypothetical protein
MFLYEKGISVPVEEVGPGEPFEPGYLARYPHRLVPMLELDDGTQIGEVVAICRYFENLQPAPPLMGTDARDRALVESWERRAYNEGMNAIEEVFRNSSPLMVGRGLPGCAEAVPQIPALGDQVGPTGVGADGARAVHHREGRGVDRVLDLARAEPHARLLARELGAVVDLSRRLELLQRVGSTADGTGCGVMHTTAESTAGGGSNDDGGTSSTGSTDSARPRGLPSSLRALVDHHLDFFFGNVRFSVCFHP